MDIAALQPQAPPVWRRFLNAGRAFGLFEFGGNMVLRNCHNFHDFRRLAKQRLPGPIFDYIDGKVQKFGVEMAIPDEVLDLQGPNLSDNERFILTLANNERVRTRAVVIASGARYR